MQPQSAILPESARHSLFIVAKLRDGSADAASVASACAVLPRVLDEVSTMGERVNGVVGFGLETWARCSPDGCPDGLRAFEAIRGQPKIVPATGGDVFFHVHSDRIDLNYEVMRRVTGPVAELLDVVEETPCSQYLDSRDLTGFIDGTENPRGDEARAEAALIADGEFAGGSFVFAQRYRHDLARWSRLSTGEQEKIVGRTKPDSVELPDDEKPPTAHISRVVIEEDGEELEIVRHGMPYQSLSGENGLMFVAYTCDLDVIEKMLRRMFGQGDDGLHDHLMEYTTPVSGAMFFAPSLALLARLAR